MRFLNLLAAAAFAATPIFAQDPPTITITKGDAVAIAVGTISGADGASAAAILKNDLAISGHFAIAAEGAAGFVATGASTGGSLQGTVKDAAGRTVLAKTYSGGPRQKVHAFADDIVETITGQKGFAQTTIAFVSSRTGRKELYTADYDGANVQQVTRDQSIAVGPSLSRDGRKLAYTGYQSGYADIYVIDLGSGSRQRAIKFPGTNTGAAFSPDGTRLAVTLSKDGNPELYITSASGGGLKRLTRTRGVESSPTWSPSGDAIIYVSDQSGRPQLYRIGAGGGSPQLVPTGHGYSTAPDWSPDGRKVAFSAGSSNVQVAVTDLSGGGTRTLASGEDPVWAGNSRHLLFSTGSSLVLLDTRTGKQTTVISGLGKVSEPTWSRP